MPVIKFGRTQSKREEIEVKNVTVTFQYEIIAKMWPTFFLFLLQLLPPSLYNTPATVPLLPSLLELCWVMKSLRLSELSLFSTFHFLTWFQLRALYTKSPSHQLTTIASSMYNRRTFLIFMCIVCKWKLLNVIWGRQRGEKKEIIKFLLFYLLPAILENSSNKFMQNL